MLLQEFPPSDSLYYGSWFQLPSRPKLYTSTHHRALFFLLWCIRWGSTHVLCEKRTHFLFCVSRIFCRGRDDDDGLTVGARQWKLLFFFGKHSIFLPTTVFFYQPMLRCLANHCIVDQPLHCFGQSLYFLPNHSIFWPTIVFWPTMVFLGQPLKRPNIIVLCIESFFFSLQTLNICWSR